MNNDSVDARGFARSPATRPGYLAGRVPANKGKSYPASVLSRTEIAALLESLDDSPSNLRLAAFITMAYRVGLGITEAVALETSDVELASGSPFVALPETPKRHARTIGIDQGALHVIRRWSNHRDSLPGAAFMCVVTGPTRGRRIDAGQLRRDLRTTANKANLSSKRVHAQGLRLTFVAELLLEQWPLPYIQKVMGYKTLNSFETTFRHLGITRPPDAEVADIVRLRPWTPPLHVAVDTAQERLDLRSGVQPAGG